MYSRKLGLFCATFLLQTVYASNFNHFELISPRAAHFRQINGHYAVQGHSRLPLSVPNDSRVQLPIGLLTFVLSRTVSNIADYWPTAKRRGIISVVSVCLSVSDDNCRKPWRRKFIFAHPVYLQVRFVYEGHRINPGQGYRSKKGRKWVFPQCKTLIGNNSASLKDRAMRFACSMGFWAMADRMVWPTSLSRDRKWPPVTKCTHSRVVGLRLDGNLVGQIFAVDRRRFLLFTFYFYFTFYSVFTFVNVCDWHTY